MTLTNPKPLGFAYGEILTSAHVNSAFAQLPYALDGNAGGTYAPSAPLIINGSGLQVGGSGFTSEATASRVCRVSLTGTNVASAAKFDIASVINDAGYTIDTGADTIAVPTTGLYLYAWTMLVTNDDATNPRRCDFIVDLNGSEVARVTGIRYSATVGDTISVSGTGVIEVTDVSHLVSLKSQVSGLTSVVAANTTRFNLVRVAQ